MSPLGVQIGAAPEAGWDDPIGLLADCHRRIEGFLQVLLRIAEMDPAQPLDEGATRAAEAALHYFRISGPLHTADEERSLFPRLNANPAATMERNRQIEGLRAEHRQAERDHATVEELSLLWTRQPLAPAAHRQLLETLSALSDLYAQHIRIEESEIFPQARTLLAAGEIARMGEEFRARRAR
jgi:hemerythrin-like domain-containing protein